MRNLIATLFQVATLGLLGVGLWLLQPFLAVAAVTGAVGYVMATDRR